VADIIVWAVSRVLQRQLQHARASVQNSRLDSASDLRTRAISVSQFGQYRTAVESRPGSSLSNRDCRCGRPPTCQDCSCQIACYQMSGLFARTKSAGRDGVRYARSKHMGDTRRAGVIFGPGAYRSVLPSTCHASSWATRMH
jgi:hypothetical protein